MPRSRFRRDLFAADRGLQLRMVVTAVLTPLVVLACLAAIAVLLPLKVAIGAGAALVFGIGAIVVERAQRPAATPLTVAEAPQLHALTERLCALADLPKPEIVREAEPEPNSWIVGVRRGCSRLHVTDGLLELLAPDELEAVVAHELAHVAHRDAAVMTAVGGPGEALAHGGQLGRFGGFFPLQAGAILAALVGLLSTVGSRSLARHRELAADRGAVALTGRPAALASALTRITGRLALIPTEDLRVAAARDAFNLLPAGEQHQGLRGRVMATHPSLQTRIARLERLEHALHAGHLHVPD